MREDATFMKHNHNHDNAPSPVTQPALQPVRSEFTHPTAITVCVAGTFNNWQPQAKPMQSTKKGSWLKETNLAPGTYEYCLVVDGQFIPDPLTCETIPNPFGGLNSVLKVPQPLFFRVLRNQRTPDPNVYRQLEAERVNQCHHPESL